MSREHASRPPLTALTRRELLALAARGAAGVVVSQAPLARALGAMPAVTGSPTTPACVLTAALEQGPFFVDEHLRRSDIRSDPASGRVVAGVPLALTFRVSRVDGRSCAPLAGAYLDVWHADSAGVYSDVAAGGPPGPPNGSRRDDARRGRPPGPPPAGFGPPPGPLGGGPERRDQTRAPGTGPKFLRGYQITDAAGTAHFTTVYPGWYDGRTVHVHFKLRLYAGERRSYEFTSQFFFDDALTDRVHAAAPYNTRGTRDVRNPDDGIYTSLGPAERPALTLRPTGEAARGYAGVIDLGVRVG